MFGLCKATIHGLALSIVIASALPARAAEKPIDFSKLKPGAALEVESFGEWIPATFVKQLSEGLIHVRHEPFPGPVGALTSKVRLPKKSSRSKAGAPGENPFATEDERVAARKPRSWSDQSGSFKVDATFLRVDDDKVVLRRADKKEISVPLERLSEADQDYVATVSGAEAANGEEAAESSAIDNKFPSRRRKDDKPAEPEFPITKTSLGAAPLIETTPVAWTYKPDPAASEAPLRNLRVPLQKMNVFERPERLLLSPVEKRAFLVTHNMSAEHSGAMSIDLQRGEGGELSVFSTNSIPIAVSADGKYVLARSKSFGFGKSAVLTLNVRQGLKVKPEKAWVPYNHHGPREESVHGPGYPKAADVTWADFLDSSHVMTLSDAGELALWNVADLKPVYQMKLPDGGQPAFSRGRKYLAAATESSVLLIHAAEGSVVGRLPADPSRFGSYLAFSPDGKKLALLSDGSRLRVWDLETQKLERDFSTVSTDKSLHHMVGDIAWVDNNYLLVGGRLIDVERRCPVAGYTGIYPWAIYGGRLYFISELQRAPAFTSAQLPTPEIKDKWASIAADDLLVVKPGMEVSVELHTNDPHTAQARERIVSSLTERGLKVVPQSDIKLVGTIGVGESKQITYNTMGGLPFNRGDTTVNVQGKVLTLNFMVKGEVVWSYQTQTSAPHFVHMKQGESVGQAAQKGADLDSKAFDNIWIPVTIAKPPASVEPILAAYPAS